MSDTVKLSAVGTLKATLGAGKINVNDYTLTVEPTENGTNISITRGSQTDTVFVPDYAEDETERKTAEEGRVSAEAGRVSAEAGRVSAEAGRVTAEDARAAAESARVSAESARADAETKRTDAEMARATAEAGRDAAEMARVEAESKRVTAETKRETAETARAAAEEKRGVDIAGLKTDVSAIKAGDTERDTRLTAIESKDVEQDSEISTLKTDSASHTESISTITSKNVEQDATIAALVAKDAAWKMLSSYRLEEDSASIVITQDSSGNDLNMNNCILLISTPYPQKSIACRVKLTDNRNGELYNKVFSTRAQSSTGGDSARPWRSTMAVYVLQANGILNVTVATGTQGNVMSSYIGANADPPYIRPEKMASISAMAYYDTDVFVADTIVTLYGN